jgi:drug/metabolite transporter (DMT)-like permease
MPDETSSAAAQEALPDRLTLTAFGALVLMGGLNFPSVKTTVQELAPMWGAGVRFAAAGLLLLAIMAVRRLPLPRGRALVGTLLFGGLSFGAFYALAYWAIEHIPAGAASVLLASTPLLTFIAAVLHGLEGFRWLTLAGALIAIAGIGIMVGGVGTGTLPLLPVLAALGGALCGAEAAVVAKKFPPVPPLVMNAVGMTVGAAITLALSFLLREAHIVPSRAATWAGLIYLILIGSMVLFGTYLFVLRRWTASGTSYAFVLFPLVAVVFAALFQGERITGGLVAGGGLVLAGVYVGALLHTGKKEIEAPTGEAAPAAVAVAAEKVEERPELAGVPADCVRCP